MKQTKPFGQSTLIVSQGNPHGRTYTPRAEAADSGPRAAASSPSTGRAKEAGGRAASNADLFSLNASVLSKNAPATLAPWLQMVRACCVVAGVVMALLIAYVLLRDSMVLANLLQQVTTEETVMICKDGKIVYSDYSILDRLMNNGRFVCTEWSVQRGFLTSPRH